MSYYYDAMYSSPTLLYIFIICLFIAALKYGGISGVLKLCFSLFAIWLIFVAGTTTLIVVFGNIHYILLGGFLIFLIYCFFRKR